MTQTGRCYCKKPQHQAELVVVTGGPGAGKTAILEMARKNFCRHVAILPEAASIIFSGGFWRRQTEVGKMAAQRAMFHVQRESEQMVFDERQWGLGLCDRGTLDGLAYWPGSEESFWQQVGSGKATELLRYKAVLHLRTPSEAMGYNHQNELRIETPEQAQVIDEKIEKIWSQHPRYMQISSAQNFIAKAEAAIQFLEQQLPDCCRLPS